MTPRLILPALASGAFFFALQNPSASAQEELRPVRPQALLAVENLKRFLNRPDLSRFVEVSGSLGTPVPTAWKVTAYQQSSPSAMEDFLVRGRNVEEQGTNREYYPEKTPEGFFEIHKVIVDSEEGVPHRGPGGRSGESGIRHPGLSPAREGVLRRTVWTIRLRTRTRNSPAVWISPRRAERSCARSWYRQDADGHMIISDSAWPGGPRPAPPRDLRLVPAPPSPVPPPPPPPRGPLEYEPQPAPAPDPAPLNEPLDPLGPPTRPPGERFVPGPPPPR